CVLVVAFGHGGEERRDQVARRVEIGEALAQVDRAVLGRELRHHRENGGAHPGQPGLQRGRVDPGLGFCRHPGGPSWVAHESTKSPPVRLAVAGLRGTAGRRTLRPCGNSGSWTLWSWRPPMRPPPIPCCSTGANSRCG